MKITGLKKSVCDYNRYNKGGSYSPEYGYLMFDLSNGAIWTDYFYSIGRNAYYLYESKSIINLGEKMENQKIKITMETVKNFINNNF